MPFPGVHTERSASAGCLVLTTGFEAERSVWEKSAFYAFDKIVVKAHVNQ